MRFYKRRVLKIGSAMSICWVLYMSVIKTDYYSSYEINISPDESRNMYLNVIRNQNSLLNMKHSSTNLGSIVNNLEGTVNHVIDGNFSTILNKTPTSHKKYTDLLWPSFVNVSENDRIVEQLSQKFQPKPKGNKLVLLINGPSDAEERLKRENCPIDACTFTYNTAEVSNANAIIHFNHYRPFSNLLNYCRPANQIVGLFLLESPYHSIVSGVSNNVINWTATYRRDSVIVTPYEKFVHFDNFTGLPNKPAKNYALGKTKKVAWFVSNCNGRNGRGNYVQELKKYISVDVYGTCGEKQCPRGSKINGTVDACFAMLNTDYKFYLSFENSNCKDYITEKLYWNGLTNDVIPVVMGARPEDYKAVAPPYSYIHVDNFPSPEDLAKYLHLLDKNDYLYNSYFRWKGTGEFINTKFWCRVCTMLHSADGGKDMGMSYNNLQSWWKGPGICIEPEQGMKWSSWRNKTYNDKNLLSTVTQVQYDEHGLTPHCQYKSSSKHEGRLTFRWFVIILSIILITLIIGICIAALIY